MTNSRQFSLIDDQDVIEDVHKVVTGLFSGGTGKLSGGNLVTKSLSSTQKNYYYTLQYSGEDQLGVSFGHMGGSGSDGSNGSLSRLVGETEAVYKSFASQLLPSHVVHKGFVFHSGSDTGFSFDANNAFHADGLKGEPGMYFITAERARMKDRVNPNNWTLQLSGSIGGSGSSQTIIHLTDNSNKTNVFPDATPAGPRYDIVSGSNGSVNDSNNIYGWFWPNMGVWAIRESAISASLPGASSYVTSSRKNGEGWNHGKTGLGMDLTISSETDNAIKLAKALSLGTQTIRAEEDQTITSYFCRARAHQFNGSVNPTWLSGSDGRMTNIDMEGNPQIFISTVGLYDSKYELIMVGKLSSPLQKNWGKENTIKVNMTF